MARTILPLERPPDVAVALPGSKSISNRYLLLAALARGESRLRRLLVADDTEAMLDCVRALGATVVLDTTGTTAELIGTAGALPSSGRCYARQSGTTARFVAPVLGLVQGPWELDGDEQLRARPMGDLFAALRHLGVRVDAAPGDTLPATLSGPIRAGRATVSGSVSSQFLSGLLLAGPLLPDGLEVLVDGELVSRPYVEMTLATMARFGGQVQVDGSRYAVAPGGYVGADLTIEPDASAASYFLAAALATGGRVRVEGLGRGSIQGDTRFIDVLAAMGATVREERDALEVAAGAELTGVEVNLADASDMVPTLAVLAALASGSTRITGVGFIRNKESDRIAAVVSELARVGIEAEAEPDGLVVHPGTPHGATVHAHGDHRIAMAFSVLGLVVPGIEIDDPGCVTKTFPEFFATLETLR